MLDAKAREAIKGLDRLLGKGLARTGITPNAVTLTGVAVTVAASWLIVDGEFTTAGFVLVVGGLFDLADGAVARATGRTTTLGAFVDSVADRVSDGLVLSTLTWALVVRGERTAAALALTALVLAMLTSYVRAKAESLGYDCKVGLVERAERLTVVIVGLVFHVFEIALGVLCVASAVTVMQRLVHVARQARGDD